MCLIVFSWQIIRSHPLIALANRDEYYDRPAQSAGWWLDHPAVYAPRDLQAGGTWMGLAKLAEGGLKVAALTNVRDGSAVQPDAPSRGHLVADYLTGDASLEHYLDMVRTSAERYAGFNLLLGEISPARQVICWFSNRNRHHPQNGQYLAPGIYGLSNGELDSPWPKVCKSKAELASLLCQHAPQEAFFELLANPLPAPDHRLPDTGVSLELERMLSATCIESEHYGTRSSTLLKVSSQYAFDYVERIIR